MAYCLDTDVAAYLGAQAPDAEMTLLTDYAASIIDVFCNRQFVATTETRLYDVPADRRELLLDKEILTCTQLVNGDGSVISPTNYVLYPLNGLYKHTIKLKWTLNGPNLFVFTTSPEGAISVTGTWGYSATAPNAIKYANVRLAAWMYRLKDSGMDAQAPQVSPSGMVILPASTPKDVVDILTRHKRTWR